MNITTHTYIYIYSHKPIIRYTLQTMAFVAQGVAQCLPGIVGRLASGCRCEMDWGTEGEPTTHVHECL